MCWNCGETETVKSRVTGSEYCVRCGKKQDFTFSGGADNAGARAVAAVVPKCNRSTQFFILPVMAIRPHCVNPAIYVLADLN